MRAILGVMAALALVTTAAADELAPPAPPPEVAAPEAAPAPPAPPAPAAQEAPQEEAHLICRRVEATGSRLSSRRQRICATAAAWEDMRSEANRRMHQAGSLQEPGGN